MDDLIAELRRGLDGRYDVGAEIARGGMSVVFRATDLKHHRPVALKVLRAGLAPLESVDRFHREIRLVAGLVHPHILPLYDSGELPTTPPLLFFAMPFILGESLRARLSREGPLPLDRALKLTREIAAALDYAHRHQIVHRDVKPENVLVHEGVALVTDFGIARLLTDGPADSVTAPGLAVGTPAYMSPEQAAGEDTLDARSDQYALACLLFEMLTGQPPFTGSVRSVMARHLTEPAPSVMATRPDVPLAIDQVIRRALAKGAEERYPTTAAFADALATPLSGFTAELLHRPAGDPSCCVAVLPFVNAGGEQADQYLSDGMTEELITALAQVKGIRIASYASSLALKGAAVDSKAAGALLGVNSIIDGSVRRDGPRLRVTARLTDTRDGTLLWTDRYDRTGDDLFGVQDEIARTIVETLRGGPLADRATYTPRRYTGSREAYAHYLKGRYAWNLRTGSGMAEAIQHFQAAIAADPGYALAYSGLSDTHALGIDYRASSVGEGMARARAEATRALELDDTLAEAHNSLAWVTFIYDWDWPKAGHHFQRAVELDPRYPTARQWRSWYLCAMGRVREGIAEARLGVELDPASVSLRRSLGWLYHMARDPAAGLDDLRRAVVMNPGSSETYLLLGQSLAWAGQLDEADIAVREAISLDPEDTHALATAARLRVMQGRLADAREFRDRLVSLARHRYVSPSDLAKAHLALNDADAAFASLEQAFRERRGFLAYARVEPQFDPIRTDPRFADLLARLRL